MMVDLMLRLLPSVALGLVCSLVALPVMKYYAHGISTGKLFTIALFAFGCWTVLIFVIYSVWMNATGGPIPSTPALLLASAFFLPAWMISAILKRQGVAKSFPGIGARAVTFVVVIWVVVGWAVLFLMMRWR
jgi:hypothetical protein